MPSKAGSLATLRPDLGSLMEFDLARNMRGFVAYRVLPIVNVVKSAGTFGRVATEYLAKLSSVLRAADGRYNRMTWKFDDEAFATQEYGLEGPVDRRNAALYRDYFDAEAETAALVLHNVLAAAEVRVAAAIFNTTTWTGASLTTAVGTEWSTAATCTPITDVKNASQKVRDNCGMYANAAILSKKVFRNLQEADQIIERIQAAGAGDKVKPNDITASMIAQCLDLEQVVVADSSYDNAKEGQSTTFTDIWDDEYCMICVLPKTGNIAEPCVGRTFHWDEDGSQPGGAVETYYSEEVRGDVVRVRHDVHEKVIYPETGHLLSNITA